MAKLGALWRGELPLGEAFWTWAIGIGLLVNLTTSVLFLALLTADRPWAALFVGYALSVPYNVLAGVGVWRSAAHYEGHPALSCRVCPHRDGGRDAGAVWDLNTRELGVGLISVQRDSGPTALVCCVAKRPGREWRPWKPASTRH